MTLFMLLLAASCGGSDSPSIVFDSRPTTTTVESVPVPTQLGRWVDATANLAGMPSECGNMSRLAARPGSDQIVAGVALQGLWASTAASDQWTKLGEGGATQITNRTSTIVFDPLAPDQFWESGSYSGPGALRTTDGGQSFEALGDLTHLGGISVDLSDPNRGTLLAGSHERHDLFRSIDGGATWTNVGPNFPPEIGFLGQPLVVSAEIHLVGTETWEPEATGIFRTTDGGTKWERVATGSVAGPPLVTKAGILFWPLKNGGLVRSTDTGATWKEMTPPGVLASYNVVELADGRIAAMGKTQLLVSATDGRAWRPIGPAIPTDGAFGLTYSDVRNAVYAWKWDCGDVVPPGSIQRLDLGPPTN